MDPLIIIGLLVLGWLLGAGVNYLSDVLPATRRFSPAVCGGCDQPLSWVEYLLLKPCPRCGHRRAWRAWVVQAAAMTVSATFGWFDPGKLGFITSLAVLFYFGVVIVIDIEHRLIMHPTSIAGAILCGAVGIWQHGILATLLGGLAGFSIMLAVYWLGDKFARWLAQRRKIEMEEEALGFGDVALSGVLGLLLGWPGIIAGLILAVLLGGAGSLIVVVYALITKKYHAFMAIPYGPFLIIAAGLLIFWGSALSSVV